MPTFIILFSLSSQILFTVIPAAVKDDTIPLNFGVGKIRIFLPLAWLFFVIGFGLSCVLAMSQAYSRGRVVARLRQHSCGNLFLVILTLLLITAILSFLFLSLTVVSYTAFVGWIAFGVSCSLAVGAITWSVTDLSW